MTTPNASEIIARVAASVAHIHYPQDRLAFQVGLLQGELRKLVWLLEDAEAQPDPTVTELADMAGWADADRRYAESKDRGDFT
jgi:hypothetical protein